MQNYSFLRLMIAAACMVVIIAGIKSASSLLIIPLYAILIAQCIDPLTIWLRSRGLSAGLAIGCTVLVAVVTGVLVIIVLGNAVQGIRIKLPEYSANISQLTAGLVANLEARGIDLKSEMKHLLDPSKIESVAIVLIGGLASMIGNSLFIIIIVVLLLLEFEIIRNKVEKREYPEGAFMYHISNLNKTSSKFIGIQALVGVMQGTVSVIILFIFGVDFALTWGILFFFLNFVPAVGFLIAVILPTLVALFENGSTTALIVFVSWYVVNIFFDNVVRPKLLKQGFNVSFIAIILVLLFWTYVLGPAGAILAIPLSLSLKLLYEAYLQKSESGAK
jgi:predicted PurR-regulated permease PerM